MTTVRNRGLVEILADHAKEIRRIKATLARSSAGGGGTDHGSLTGLGDDDHFQYHTDGRALTWLGTRSTTDLSEGTNLYYTNTRADGRIAAADLGDIGDVGITAIAGEEILKWSGTAWINNTLAEAGIAATSDLHTKYTDGEAVSAVGTPWVGLIAAEDHHSKYTDGEVDAIVLTHKNLASAHHSKYTDGEVDAIVLTHKNLASAHHSKYTDSEAAAKILADDDYVKIAGDTMSGNLAVVGSALQVSVDDINGMVGDVEADLLVLKHTVNGSESALNEFDPLKPHAGITFLRDWTSTESTLAKIHSYGDAPWGGGLIFFVKPDDGASGGDPVPVLDLTPNLVARFFGTVDMQGNTLLAPLDPTAGTHVADRDYNDARYADVGLEHSRYEDSEAVTAVGTPWVGLIAAEDHHSKYTDGNAVSAMGVLGNGNALNHTRYSDANAVSAVGTPWVGLIAAEDHHTKYTDSQAAAKIASDALYALTGHTIVSHDTTATGSNLNTLTGGGNADSLHGHAGSGAPDMDSITDVTISAVTTGEVLQKSAGDWINQTLSEAGILGLGGGTMTGDLNMGGNFLYDVNEIQVAFGSETDPTFTFNGDSDTGMYRTGINALGLAAGGTLVLDMVASGIYPKTVFRHIDGSVGAPSYAFGSDSNTGMYRLTTDTLGLATGGAIRMQLNSAGVVIYQDLYMDEGIIYAVNEVQAQGGSATDPSFTFTDDPNTGMYSAGADRLTFARAGVLRYDIVTTHSFHRHDGTLGYRVGSSGGAYLTRTYQANGSTVALEVLSTNLKFAAQYNSTTTGTANFYITSAGNFRRSTASSRRYKNRIKDLDVSGVLRPRSFHYIPGYVTDDPEGDLERYYFIAEEVEAEWGATAVEYDEDGQLEDVNVKAIVAILALQVNELRAQVKELQGQK